MKSSSVALSYLLLSCLTLGTSGCFSEKPTPPPEPMSEEYVMRGAMLARGLAACGYCHGGQPDPDSPLTGGRVQHDIYGDVIAANITPADSGIGGWRNVDVVRALRGAVNRDGDPISLDVHRGFEWMSDRDTLAIVAFLRAIPPAEAEHDRRSLGTLELNTTGVLERRNENQGFVPEISPRHELQYGRYLVDHVARCGSCHTQPETLFRGEVYLGGGAVVRVEDEERVAPSIAPGSDVGVGGWSEEVIVGYLQTGVTAEGEQRDAAFCPINFYRNAPREQLVAIARYLKSTPASR